MAVEGVSPQHLREAQVRPSLDQAEVVEALRHGNIYEVLRAPGVNRRDIEEYLSGQSRLFQNQILQEYEVYSGEASVPPPELEAHFPVHQTGVNISQDERHLFKREMAMVAKAQMARATEDGQGIGAGGEGGEEAASDIGSIAQKSLGEWNDFFSELQMKVIDTQMFRDLHAKTAELNKEVQRIIALVMSGQVDPEYVLIAAAKSNMLQNGTLFTWKGKRIMHLNEELNKYSKDLIKMNPNDAGYFKEMQLAQSKTRSGSTQMQMEMMDLQKYSQNVATTLEWASNAIRMFAQMRQTPTQAIAVR